MPGREYLSLDELVVMARAATWSRRARFGIHEFGASIGGGGLSFGREENALHLALHVNLRNGAHIVVAEYAETDAGVIHNLTPGWTDPPETPSGTISALYKEVIGPIWQAEAAKLAIEDHVRLEQTRQLTAEQTIAVRKAFAKGPSRLTGAIDTVVGVMAVCFTLAVIALGLWLANEVLSLFLK